MDQSCYGKFSEVEKKHWWFSGRRTILRSLFHQIDLPKNSRILDAGCGTGGSFELLAPLGNIYGMDVNESALSAAGEKGYVSLSRCDLPDEIPFGGTRFDLIVLLDVLEHLEKDRESLDALRQRLNPGGWLLVTVPAYPWMWSGHDVLNHHYRRYTRRSLLGLFQELDMEIVWSSYFNSILFPVALLARFLHAVAGQKGLAKDLDIPPRILNKILYTIFQSERHLIHAKGLPFGLSLLALAKARS